MWKYDFPKEIICIAVNNILSAVCLQFTMLPTKYPKSLITIIKWKISNFDGKIRAETSSMNLVHIRQILRACTGCSAEIFTLFTILNLLEKSFRIEKNLFSIKVRYISWLLRAQISVLKNESFAAESIFRQVCLELHRLV